MLGSDDIYSQLRVPPEYICPITQELMRDPVLTADGQTYEREAIERWLRNSYHSPMTNLRLRTKDLIPNHALRNAIESFVTSLPSDQQAIIASRRALALESLPQRIGRIESLESKAKEESQRKVRSYTRRLESPEIEAVTKADLLRKRGEAYQDLEDYSNAEADLTKALQIAPQDEVYSLYFAVRGKIYYEMHNLERALSDFNEALERTPRDFDSLAFRGATYLQLERYEEAFQDLHEAVGINSRDEFVQAQLHVAESHRSRAAEAPAADVLHP